MRAWISKILANYFSKKRQRELVILLISGILSFGIALLVFLGTILIILHFTPSTKVMPDGTVEHYQAIFQAFVSGVIAFIVFVVLVILCYRFLNKRMLLKWITPDEVLSDTPDMTLVFVLIVIVYALIVW